MPGRATEGGGCAFDAVSPDGTLLGFRRLNLTAVRFSPEADIRPA